MGLLSLINIALYCSHAEIRVLGGVVGGWGGGWGGVVQTNNRVKPNFR